MSSSTKVFSTGIPVLKNGGRGKQDGYLGTSVPDSGVNAYPALYFHLPSLFCMIFRFFSDVCKNLHFLTKDCIYSLEFVNLFAELCLCLRLFAKIVNMPFQIEN
jgi:hypothetical protein